MVPAEDILEAGIQVGDSPGMVKALPTLELDRSLDRRPTGLDLVRIRSAQAFRTREQTQPASHSLMMVGREPP